MQCTNPVGVHDTCKFHWLMLDAAMVCRTGLDCQCRVSGCQIAWLALTGILHALQVKAGRHRALIAVVQAMLQRPRFHHCPVQLRAVVVSKQNEVFRSILL